MAKKNIGEAVVKLYNNNGGPLDGRTYFELEQSETIESLFSNLPSGYKIGEEITILLQNGTVEKYKVTGLERNYISDYELIQEPKDLKYSDNTSFLNSDNEIDIDTLKLKNIPELQPVSMLDGFYYTISNNTPWEGQILTTPIYHINNQYLEISIPSVLPKPSNLGEFSQSLINAYPALEDKQLEISIFNINKCSNGYLSSNSSYKFKIPLDITSDKTVIKIEDGINLECGIGIQTNYQLTIALPENEPNISDYRVVLSFSNIQDVSGKIDKISNFTSGNLPKLNSEGNLVDSEISANSILTKVTGTNLNGKLVTLDANGNITNSGESLSDLRAELDEEYIPKPSTDPTDGQILSYDENDGTKWIDNTTVHIKYAATDTPTENQMHNSIQSGDLYIGIYSDNNLSDSTSYTDYEWSKIVGIDGINGMSAFEIWKEETSRPTATKAEYIADLQTKVVRWIPVVYEATAASATIGDTVTFTTAPSNPIDGAIVLMPNAGSGATASMMFAVSSDGQTPATYTYTYIGDLDVDTTGLLDISDMDGTELKNPTSAQVAKATDVMQLSAKLEGVTLSESKVTNWADWYPSGESTGYYNILSGSPVWSTNVNFCTTRITIPEGIKRVRFDGCNYPFSTIKPCYGFADINGDLMINTLKPYYDATKENGNDIDILIDVPDGAAYFLCLYKMFWSSNPQTNYVTQNKFYIYLQSGDNVDDLLTNITGKDIVTISDIIPNSIAGLYQIRRITNINSEDTAFYRSQYANSYIRGLSDYHGLKLKVINSQNNSNPALFVILKKTVQNLSYGTTLTLSQLVNQGYLSSYHNISENIWESAREVPANGGVVELIIPDDAYSIIATGKPIGSEQSNIGSLLLENIEHRDGVLDDFKREVEEMINDGEDETDLKLEVTEKILPSYKSIYIGNTYIYFVDGNSMRTWFVYVKQGEKIRIEKDFGEGANVVVKYGLAPKNKPPYRMQGVEEMVDYPILFNSYLDGNLDKLEVEFTAETDDVFFWVSYLKANGVPSFYRIKSIQSLQDALTTKSPLIGSMTPHWYGEVGEIIANVNYLECSQFASDEIKLVTNYNFSLNTHMRLLIKMTNANTHATPKLNINNTGAKEIWYNGAIASNENTWSAGEVLDVYYDGTKYIAISHGNVSTNEQGVETIIDTDIQAMQVSDVYAIYNSLITNNPLWIREESPIGTATLDNTLEIKHYVVGYQKHFLTYDYVSVETSSNNKIYNDNGVNHDMPHIIIDAGIHGDEKAAVLGLAKAIEEIVTSTEPWAMYIKTNFIIDVIPVVSPYTFNAGTRYMQPPYEDPNDPNRDYDTFTWNESKVMKDFVRSVNARCFIDCHNLNNATPKKRMFVSYPKGGIHTQQAIELSMRLSSMMSQLIPSTYNYPTDPKVWFKINQDESDYSVRTLAAFMGEMKGILSFTLESPRNNNYNNGSNTDAGKHCTSNAAILMSTLVENVLPAVGALVM